MGKPSRRRRDGYYAFLPHTEPRSQCPDFLEGWRLAQHEHEDRLRQDAEEAERLLPLLTALQECETVADLKLFIFEHLIPSN